MGYLVELAKKYGIKPNPFLTHKEAKELVNRIKEILKTGEDAYTQKKMDAPSRFSEILYARQKCVTRQVDEKMYEANIQLFNQVHDEIITSTQFSEIKKRGFDLTGSFIHQTAKGAKPACERFVCDIDVSSKEFPKVFENLRAFIIKHQAAFKVPTLRSLNRSDALNCYLSKPITSEIAAEFYQIVKPCLKDTFDDKLDGFEIFCDGKKIKGIRIGPEYYIQDKKKRSEIERVLLDRLLKARMDLPKTFSGAHILLMGAGANANTTSSLGEKCSQIEVFDFAYYMAGMEGKSPVKLLDSSFSKPYQNKIDISSYLNEEKEGLSQNKEQQSPVAFEEKNKTFLTTSLARKVAAFFVVKNGVLQFKEDLTAFDLARKPKLKIYEILGIKAKPLKRKNGDIYAYVPTSLQDHETWNAFLKLVQQENFNNAEPKKISKEDVNKIILTAASDFKSEGDCLYFRDLNKKQEHSGLNAYMVEGKAYQSLPRLLREKYHIFTTPLFEKGECVGFKILGDKAKTAASHLLYELKQPEKQDVLRLSKEQNGRR